MMTNAYHIWIYDQLEPDEKLITGRKKKREKPGWMLKPEPRKVDTEDEMLAKEKLFLSKHGIDF